MPTCPSCNADIPTADVNAGEGIALCRACGKVHRLSAIIDGVDDHPAADPASPPRGAWLIEEIEGWRTGADFRGVVAFILIAFTVIWGGGSMAGIYGTQLFKGRFDLGQSLFGIPFLLGTIVLITVTLFLLRGSVEFRQRGNEVEFTLGVFGIGRRRRFAPADVTAIRLERTGWHSNGDTQYKIVIDGPAIEFGALLLNRPKRAFLLAALRSRLLDSRRT